MGAAPVRLVAADDHRMLREALCDLLSVEPDLTVVGQAAAGPETVAVAAELRPDIVLMDVEMPGPGAQATLRELRRSAAEVRVIVLTMHDDVPLMQSLLAEGIAGYVHKSATREALVAAIRNAMAGSTTLSVPSPAVMEPAPVGKEASLTPREREVLECVAQAKSNREIGAALSISEGTVKRHMRNIFRKLGATSRLDAVNKASSQGARKPLSFP